MAATPSGSCSSCGGQSGSCSSESFPAAPHFILSITHFYPKPAERASSGVIMKQSQSPLLELSESVSASFPLLFIPGMGVGHRPPKHLAVEGTQKLGRAEPSGKRSSPLPPQRSSPHVVTAWAPRGPLGALAITHTGRAGALPALRHCRLCLRVSLLFGSENRSRSGCRVWVSGLQTRVGKLQKGGGSGPLATRQSERGRRRRRTRPR